jgi:hypothetical protein
LLKKLQYKKVQNSGEKQGKLPKLEKIRSIKIRQNQTVRRKSERRPNFRHCSDFSDNPATVVHT